MTITHNKGTGKTTIKLSWQETRHFMALPAAQKKVATSVRELVASK